MIVDRRDLLRGQRRRAACQGIQPRDPIRVAAMLIAEEFDHDPLPEYAPTGTAGQIPAALTVAIGITAAVVVVIGIYPQFFARVGELAFT